MPERLIITNTSPLLYLHLVGHLEAVRPVIERLRASGQWLSTELVAMVLAQVGE